MTIYAEIFPVGAVGGIVLVVAVFVVDGEQVLVFDVKLSSTLGTD